MRPRLGTLRNANRLRPIEGLHFHFGTQGRLSNIQRQSAVQIIFSPLEHRMFRNLDHHIKIAGNRTFGPRISFRRQPKPRPGINPRRNVHFQLLLSAMEALAPAL